MTPSRSGVWPGQVYVSHGIQYQILGRYQDHIWYLNMSLRAAKPRTTGVSFFEQRGMRLKYDLEAA